MDTRKATKLLLVSLMVVMGGCVDATIDPGADLGDDGKVRTSPRMLFHVPAGEWTGDLLAPGRLAFTATEGLVTDAMLGAVVRFDLTTDLMLGTFPVPEGPVGIATAAGGLTYVSRMDGEVGVYDAAWAHLRNLAEGTFVQPTDVMVDPAGKIYVVDSGADTVYIFNSDETADTSFGGRGADAGQFKYPSSIAYDTSRDLLVVGDQDNFRLQVFGLDGSHVLSFGYRVRYTGDGTTAEAWLPRTAGLAVDAGGYIYAGDGLMGVVRIFNQIGADLGEVLGFLEDLGGLVNPGGIGLNGTKVYVANTGAGQVQIYDAEAPGDLDTVFAEHSAGANPGIGAAVYGWTAPHMQTDTTCGRCHDIDDEPGGHLGLSAGQANLCFSCHTAGGQAPGQLFFIDGSNSHAWDVLAENSEYGSDGITEGGPLDGHLDAGSIKCATCHDQHTDAQFQPYLRMDIKDSQLCGDCHYQEVQWQNAGHSDWSSRAFTYAVREACAECHVGWGFVGFANGEPRDEWRLEEQVHACFVCHATHGSTNPALMRVYDNVTLPGDYEVTDYGTSATCVVCHNGRRAPDDGGLPHYALGGATLIGINGIDFGYELFNSFHTDNVLCVRCHMAETPADGEFGHDKLGEHAWSMVVHNEGQPDDGAENAANACSPCHSIETYNDLVRGDFDGDGADEGVQDEVTQLLVMVFDSLHDAGAVFLGHYPYWNFDGVEDIPPGRLQEVKDAAWNYEYVDNDGSLGVHNTSYSVGLLQVTFIVLGEQPVPPWDARFLP